jgi:branched-chain amino acid transport system ATP-binding protein
MTQTLLEVDRLTAGYDGPPVLREVSFAVRAGEVVALLGANGAGKTTTLRGACGLLAPRGGQIRYLGRPVASAAPQRLSRDGLVHVPEGKGLFFALTVAEHFRLLGAERRTIEEAYRYFPALEPLSRRRAGLLSGGEQQMLALACAIMRLPRVLLVDELSLGLAPVIVERLLPILRGYADEHQAGVLMVEQHAQLALGVADRAVVLTHGTVALDLPARALAADQNLLRRSYLGAPAPQEAPPTQPPDQASYPQGGR